jgi:hypothetical protein
MIGAVLSAGIDQGCGDALIRPTGMSVYLFSESISARIDNRAPGRQDNQFLTPPVKDQLSVEYGCRAPTSWRALEEFGLKIMKLDHEVAHDVAVTQTVPIYDHCLEAIVQVTVKFPEQLLGPGNVVVWPGRYSCRLGPQPTTYCNKGERDSTALTHGN